MTSDRISTQHVVDEFASALKEAEGLLEQVGSDAGEKAQKARARLQATLREARDRLIDLEDVAMQRSRAAARAADDYVHEHPWQVLGVAAVVGIVVGLLVSRR